jgi:hypothetical protein
MRDEERKCLDPEQAISCVVGKDVDDVENHGSM